ncbi:MAG: hypothetical protein ITG02_14380 [Patulibacter sp.]|nr:hypothetical protein [Patulibacter sp.]
MRGEEFEEQVLRIARAMWPQDWAGGSAMIDGRERDGVFITDDAVALIEATTERSQEKAVKDGKKLAALALKYGRQYPMHSVKAYFVTYAEPTAHQRDAIRDLKTPAVVAVSFAQFRDRLVNASAYVEARDDHPFGSARGLSIDASFKDVGEYVGLGILERGPAGSSWSIRGISDAISDGGRFVILADFGAGKSMTMRELFKALAADFRRGLSVKFPIHLNLGEHHGQTDPSEALIRHATRIGFEHPSQLVRAWKSGYAVLLLDGFDEMSAPTWTGDVALLREARRNAVELVRRIFEFTPGGSGIVIAGREYYFDSAEERRVALGYSGTATQLTLNDFTDEQVKEFIKRQDIPEWLPRRPFLLGYLAARGLLPGDDVDAGAAEGWDVLLDGIADREAKASSSIPGSTVRRILERLGSHARGSADGLGPLESTQIIQVFNDVVGRAADVQDYVLLQRLPGLQVSDELLGSRKFVDASLAEAAAAGDLFEFALSPHSPPHGFDPGRLSRTLGSLGAEIVAHRLERANAPVGVWQASAEHAVDRGWNVLGFDLVRSIEAGGHSLSSTQIPIEGVAVEELEIGFGSGSLHGVRLADSVIRRLSVNAPIGGEELPTFVRCLFAGVSGVSGRQDLPAERFIDCEFEDFSEATDSTQSILQLNIPLQVRVGLTIIKKLYVQRGTGRRDEALRRGLDYEGQQLVDPALAILQEQGLTKLRKRGKQRIWLPIAGKRQRAVAMLTAPMASDDPVIAALRAL